MLFLPLTLLDRVVFGQYRHQARGDAAIGHNTDIPSLCLCRDGDELSLGEVDLGESSSVSCLP